MSATQELSTISPWKRVFNALRPFATGMVPLFILAHFSHHGVGAMLNPLMPMIRSDLGLNLTQAGLMMSAFTITNGFAQLPAGWLADRVGARFMILLAITGVAVAGFFIGFASSLFILVPLLVLVALLGGGYHPAAATAISASVPPAIRGRALGVHLIGGTSAFWLIPLIIAPIAATWGWRMPYRIIPIPFALLGILVFILISRQMRVEEAKKQANGVAAQSVDKTPINWSKLAPFMVMSVLVGALMASSSSYLSFYAVDELGVPATTIPLIVAIPAAMGLVMAPLGGYLSDRYGGLKIIMIFGIAVVPLIFLMGKIPSVGALIALMLVMGLVNNTRMPTTESYIVGNTPDNRRSTVLGIYFFAGAEIAGPLTPLVGNLIDNYGYQQTFTITAAAAAVVTIVCAFFIWRAGKSR